jgi:predicted ribosome quality control (RQC) complex YloA/Tae2 family protein
MIYDAFILSAITDELTRTLTGGKIERITQPTALDVVIRVYTSTGKYDLLLSCDADLAGAHLTWIKRENPPQPYAFCMVLRKYIDGARITGFERPGGFGERILVIRCKGYDGAPFSLVVEIMGKLSNVILINGPETVLGAAKHITSEINRYREVLPGLPYRPPPRQRAKLDPLQPFVGDESAPMLEEDAVSWLVQTFSGVSPILARETVVRTRETGALLTQETLWNTLSDVLDVVRTGHYTPIVWSDDTGVTQGAYPIHLHSITTSNQYDRQSMSIALDNASSSIGKRSAFESARDSLTTALHRKQRLFEQTEIERGLANADRADEYQQDGDLIQANQHAFSRGQSSIDVADYYAEHTEGPMPTRTIPLDPTLGLRENAERYYKKAAKARASRMNLEERRATLQEEMRLLDRAEADLPSTTTEDQVEEIHERVSSLLLRGSQRPAAENGSGAPPEVPRFDGHKIRTFRSVDGWEILVGENATSNDFLTTKVASSSDIWLHVRAATSAHGIIRAQNRPASVSAAAIRHAAELVAARSEVKHSSLIPVDYTLKKYVRKPRKSAPGSVTYQNEKTIYVGGINSRD